MPAAKKEPVEAGPNPETGAKRFELRDRPKVKNVHVVDVRPDGLVVELILRPGDIAVVHDPKAIDALKKHAEVKAVTGPAVEDPERAPQVRVLGSKVANGGLRL